MSSRIRRVGLNSLARLAAQVAAKVLTLTLTGMMLQRVGAADLGRYLMALTVGGIVLATADLGLGVYLTREVARLVDVDCQRRVAGEVIILKVVLAAIGYALLLVASLVLPLPAQTRRLLPLAGLSLMPDAATSGLQSYLTGQQRLDLASGLMVGVRSLGAVVGAVALLAGGGVAAVLWAGVAASAIGLIASLRVLRRAVLPPLFDVNVALLLPKGRSMLSESYPFAATGIIAMLYTRLDLLLLGALHGEIVAGRYGAAYRLWEAVHLLPSSLLDALFPEMARQANRRGGLHWLRRLLTCGVGTLALAGVMVALGATLLGGTLMGLVYGPDASSGATLQTWRLLCWAIPAVFVYLLGGQVLYATGAQRKVTVWMMVIAGANALANVVLIPRWQHVGAALSMVASEWMLAFLLWLGAWRHLAEQPQLSAEGA